MSLPLPRRRVLALLLFAAAAALGGCQVATRDAGPADASGYLFCFWNVENLFDDEPNPKLREPDRHFDRWFAEDAEARAQKYKNLADAVLSLNGGKGPDVLAVAEVESRRAAVLLQQALNKRLGDERLHYTDVVYRNPSGGRHIATAVLTRLKVAGEPRLLGTRLRILEIHLEAGGRELVVIASHWTSRVSDKSGKGRAHYGDAIYRRFRRLYEGDPKVDLLVCGDFNDNPDEPSVTEHLHATGDRDKALAGGDEPYLYDLFAKLWENKKGTGEVGSHFYGPKTHPKAYIFDQICVSPGLLDNSGWSCDPDSARIEKPKTMADRRGHPLRFGNPKDRVPLSARGASDHFPVTVRLTVAR